MLHWNQQAVGVNYIRYPNGTEMPVYRTLKTLCRSQSEDMGLAQDSYPASWRFVLPDCGRRGRCDIQATGWNPVNQTDSGIRWRLVWLFGCGLTAVNAVWLSYMEMMWNQGYATLLSLSYNAVFTLCVLLLGNRVAQAFGIRVLTQTELLLLFLMVSIGTGIASLTTYLTSLLAFATHFATLSPLFHADLLPHVSSWLVVTDAQAADAFYRGGVRLWNWQALRPWIAPFVSWGVFLMALVWTGYCLSSLVYSQWRHQERLPFPLIQIPLMITEPGSQSFRSRLFWLAFLIAGTINVVNALALLFPTVPYLPVKRQLFEIAGLPRPWSSLSPVLFSFNPLLIGLEFFLPVDMLFSLVAFYWIGRLQGVAFAWLGADASWPVDSMVAPYIREQATGALLALVLYAFWMARHRWREAWLRYPMDQPVRRAAAGAAAGTLLMAGILLLTGMSLWLAAAFLAIYLLITLSAAHIRAQYGPPSVGLMLGAPGPLLYALMGRNGLGAQGLSGLTITHWLGREICNSPLPPTLEAHALLENRRAVRLPVCLMLAALAGYAAGYGTALVTGYTFGHNSAHTAGTQRYFGYEAYMLFTSRMNAVGGGATPDALIATATGGLVALLLQAVRTRLLGFPLHPVGYAVASSYIATYVWSTALIVWAFKLLLMRYTGLKGYYRAAPFFLGLLLGDFVIGSLISLIGVAAGMQTYVFWPY